MANPSKRISLRRLQKAIDDMDDLHFSTCESPEFLKWERDVQVAITNTFGNDSRHLTDFKEIRFTPIVSSYLSPIGLESDMRDACLKGLEGASAILTSMINEIEEYWEEDFDDVRDSVTIEPESLASTTEVFLIHGHDHGTKETVARFLQGLDLKPIILHEQPNQGRTIIEKFEDYARTSYAIALLTPDDMGGPDADQLKPRARQNVILEMGFFWGSLGRGRVAALLKDDLDVPSDYDGVVYIELDDNDGWQMKLARELKAAEFDIDLNKLA